MTGGNERAKQRDTDRPRSSSDKDVHDVFSCHFDFIADQIPIAVPAASQTTSSAAVTPNN